MGESELEVHQVLRIRLCTVKNNILVVLLLSGMGDALSGKDAVERPPGSRRIVWRDALLPMLTCRAKGPAHGHPAQKHCIALRRSVLFRILQAFARVAGKIGTGAIETPQAGAALVKAILRDGAGNLWACSVEEIQLVDTSAELL